MSCPAHVHHLRTDVCRGPATIAARQPLSFAAVQLCVSTPQLQASSAIVKPLCAVPLVHAMCHRTTANTAAAAPVVTLSHVDSL
jgi:hypothetical protein